jgi:hypothetical protein
MPVSKTFKVRLKTFEAMKLFFDHHLERLNYDLSPITIDDRRASPCPFSCCPGWGPGN